jgi:excisionase family DNA binding protein
MNEENEMSNYEWSIGERLLKAADVARILNISKAMAYRLIQQGALPVVRINHAVRVKPSDLAEYVQRARTGDFQD